MGREKDIAPVYIEGDIIPYFVIAYDSADGVSLPDASKESILWAESGKVENTIRHIDIQ